MARGSLLRSAAGRGQLWAGISHIKESEKEREQQIKSRRAFEKESASGRFFGGTGGAGGGFILSLLLDAMAPGVGTAARPFLISAGAGLGSRGGQEFAVSKSKEAMEKPGVGIWDVASGREERKAEDIYRKSAMGARSLQDLQTAFWAALAMGQIPGLSKGLPLKQVGLVPRVRGFQEMKSTFDPVNRGLIQNLRMIR